MLLHISSSASIEQLRKQHDFKKRQLDILYEDRLSERISPERYDELSKNIAQEQSDIEASIVNIDGQSRKRLKTGIDVLEKSQEAAKVYRSKSPEDKRKLLDELFTSLHLDGTKLTVEYNPYAVTISKAVERHNKIESDFRIKDKPADNWDDAELQQALHTAWRTAPDVLIKFKTAIITISQEIAYAKQFLSEAGSVPAFIQA